MSVSRGLFLEYWGFFLYVVHLMKYMGFLFYVAYIGHLKGSSQMPY